MNRYIDLNEVSDGKLYGPDDLVRAGCGDCEGCSFCCEHMADTIILDPLDIYHLTAGLHVPGTALMNQSIELGVVDGIVLPHIRIADDTEGRCPFLTDEGRCSIHDFRPGFCRLFPLGRYYENRSLRYFLQVKECRRKNRSKVRVRKWIGVEDFDRYERFVSDWHYFLKDLQDPLSKKGPEEAKQVSLLILNEFIFTPYDTEKDFYPQFYERLKSVSTTLQAASML